MNKIEFIDACIKIREDSMAQAAGLKKGNSDGVISIERYYDYPGRKILWLLKESWGEGSSNQADDLSKVEVASDYFSARNEDGFQTYAPMILLAGMMHGLSIPDVYLSKEAYSSFVESTAFVNCKKVPGATKSNDKEIGLFAKQNERLIEEQIRLYNPSIIIGGNTLRLFFPVKTSSSSIFEQIKLHQNAKVAKGIEGIASYNVFGDTVDVEDCRAINKNGYDFGVYPGKKILFIDADHPSSAKRMQDYCFALFDIIMGYRIIEDSILI